MHVHGVELPAGTVSFGHFWADRHYNAYHWLDGPRTRPSGFTSTSATNPHRPTSSTGAIWSSTCWRPAAAGWTSWTRTSCRRSCDADVAAHIDPGKAAILRAPGAVTAEIEAASRALFPLAFVGTDLGPQLGLEPRPDDAGRPIDLRARRDSRRRRSCSRPRRRRPRPGARPADAASAPTTACGRDAARAQVGDGERAASAWPGARPPGSAPAARGRTRARAAPARGTARAGAASSAAGRRRDDARDPPWRRRRRPRPAGRPRCRRPGAARSRRCRRRPPATAPWISSTKSMRAPPPREADRRAPSPARRPGRAPRRASSPRQVPG